MQNGNLQKVIAKNIILLFINKPVCNIIYLTFNGIHLFYKKKSRFFLYPIYSRPTWYVNL